MAVFTVCTNGHLLFIGSSCFNSHESVLLQTKSDINASAILYSYIMYILSIVILNLHNLSIFRQKKKNMSKVVGYYCISSKANFIYSYALYGYVLPCHVVIF